MKDLLLCLMCGAFGGILVTYVLEMLAGWFNERKNKENDW